MKKLSWKSLKDEFRHLVRGDIPSWRIAAGIALGVFVGIVGPYGTHLLLALALAWMFRVDRIAAALGTFVNSPLTAVPIYYLGWEIGSLLLGRSGEFPLHVVKKKAVWNFLGDEIFAPLMSGLAIEGTVAAMLAYVATKSAIDHLRRRNLQVPS